jgi:hypothetical protein
MFSRAYSITRATFTGESQSLADLGITLPRNTCGVHLMSINGAAMFGTLDGTASADSTPLSSVAAYVGGNLISLARWRFFAAAGSQIDIIVQEVYGAGVD